MIKMSRKLLSVLLIGLISFSSSSPSQASLFGNSADTKRVIASLKKLAVTENKILAKYNSVTGSNYKDDYTTGMALVDLLPQVNSYIGKLEALNPKDPKLAKAVDLLVQGWNKQAEGMTLLIGAIDQQDYEKLSKGNAALASGRATLKKAASALAPFIK